MAKAKAANTTEDQKVDDISNQIPPLEDSNEPGKEENESEDSKPDEPIGAEVLESLKDLDGSEIIEHKDYKIIILKDHKGLVAEEVMTVSGNVAKALITKGLAKLK